MNCTKLSYFGSVSATLEYKGKRIKLDTHNAGTHYLMKSFAKILTGYFDNAGTCTPQYLSVDYVDLTGKPEGYVILESDWKPFVNQLIPIKEKQYYPKEDSSTIAPYAEFVTQLASGDLNEPITSVDPTKSYRLSLRAGKNSSNVFNVLATLPISQETLMKISPGTQATVTWDMQVTNKVEEE